MNYILETRNLSKSYQVGKRAVEVLKKVNLRIKAGEFVAVMGPSGSGKSTLLYNVSGMDRMSSGEVTFNNRDLFGMKEAALSRLRLWEMGFVFQQIHLLKNLSIMDNIVVPGYLASKHSRDAVKCRATDLMERVGILSLADNDITQASGGQLQRAAICRALINEPDILFCDEPTGALNSRMAMEVMDILLDINRKGTGILLVTHDVKVAANAHRVLFMKDGELVAERECGPYGAFEDGKERERSEQLANRAGILM